VIGECDIEDAIKRAESSGDIPKDIKSNLDAMMAIAKTPKKNQERTMNFHFLASPIEIKGNGKVEEVVFAINKAEGGKVTQTAETYTVKAGLIISAIGYEAEPIPGVPYVNGKVENLEGRVRNTNIYVVGWAKRGPSGVIGTNKSDAAAVIEHLVSDLKNPKSNNGIASLLKDRGVIHISQGNWEKLNSAEVSAGTPSGKPRIKFTDRKEMLGFAG
ncbi:MAG: hypothetical protein ACKOCR_10735, partial [Burkholderiaceae bacterium]